MAEVNDLETTDANNTTRFPEGMTGAQVNNSARALEGILARWFNDTNGSLTSGGSSNAYTLSPNRTITAHYDGLPFVFEANHTNTGAATLQLSGLNAKDIRRTDDSALTGGEIVSGGKYFVVFDSSTDRWQLMNPLTVASVDITNRTAETDPATGDELLIEDVSASANRKMTLANLLKVITDLTAETSPATGDQLAMYDADGGATDKITLANLLKVINGLTEDTDPDETADFLLTYDASASAAKKSKIQDVVQAELNANAAIAKAWGYVTVSGGSPTLEQSHNVASITDSGTGQLTVNVDTDFANTNYAVVLGAERDGDHLSTVRHSSRAVGSFRIDDFNPDGLASRDPDAYNFACFGAQ